jgi:hypothetical protein
MAGVGSKEGNYGGAKQGGRGQVSGDRARLDQTQGTSNDDDIVLDHWRLQQTHHE